jgi:two-component system OmpR family response regulator
MRLLVVEDDVSLAEGLVTTLTQAGYQVDCAGSVAEATLRLERQEFSLVILDLGLPDGDGIDILRALRRRKQVTPVLILSARDAVGERIRGLDHGADDYLTKPFALTELEARVRALIRRSHGVIGSEVTCGRLTLDPQGRVASVDGRIVDLSAREYGVLECLILRQGKVVSKEQMVQHLCDWDQDIGENAIEVYVHRLRKKVEGTVNIRTVRGLGYLLEKPSAAPGSPSPAS